MQGNAYQVIGVLPKDFDKLGCYDLQDYSLGERIEASPTMDEQELKLYNTFTKPFYKDESPYEEICFEST
tara:strand:+ start:14323 stop:14532 length:210 start_codon:yes stop_codon:yes gene_type:complete